MTPFILTFPDLDAQGLRLARLVGAEACPLGLHRFPDGETLVTVPPDVAGRRVALLTTLRDPDPQALPLRFAAQTLRELGAAEVGLVAPYLAYMRQDRRFVPGQAVSARLFAAFLSESLDWLVTVDPHLHRIARLDRLFTIPADRVAAAPVLADWIAAEVPDGVLLGPDDESRQWVAEVAQRAGRPHEVLHKTRRGDYDVELSLPESPALHRGTPVVLDDIASSGRTMAQAVERLVAAGTRPPVCIVIHAVFAGDAEDIILRAGAARIVSTDTIAHPTNAMSMAGPLADALRARWPAGR